MSFFQPYWLFIYSVSDDDVNCHDFFYSFVSNVFSLFFIHLFFSTHYFLSSFIRYVISRTTGKCSLIYDFCILLRTTTTLVYYGLSLNATSFSYGKEDLGPFVDFIFSALMEIPGIFRFICTLKSVDITLPVSLF